jgi:predicted nucleotidyltransferase
MDRDALFGSQHLPLVLSVLTAAPGREFGVRELMALLHTGKDNVQRALSRAVASGVASRRVTAHGHRFTALTDSPIYPELKLLLAKSHGLGKILADHFGDRIRLAYLFGSVATATDSAESDVDLLVVGEPSLDELYDAVLDFQRQVGRSISILALSAEEWEIARLDDPFLRVVESGPRAILVAPPEPRVA